MGRIRTVKPELFKHDGLFDAEIETGLPLRLTFIGLWTQCDRDGRFRWRPRSLKTDILPYDEIDISRVLDALGTRGFVVKYACQGEKFGYIPSWHRHQVVNNRESKSEIPPPPPCATQPTEAKDETDASVTRRTRDTVITKGKGREGKRKGKGSTVLHYVQNRARLQPHLRLTMSPNHPKQRRPNYHRCRYRMRIGFGNWRGELRREACRGR